MLCRVSEFPSFLRLRSKISLIYSLIAYKWEQCHFQFFITVYNICETHLCFLCMYMSVFISFFFHSARCSTAKSCPTVCSPLHCSPSGSSVRGISQARILEWVAISSFRGSFQPRDGTRISYISCIGRELLYHWDTWKAPILLLEHNVLT